MPTVQAPVESQATIGVAKSKCEVISLVREIMDEIQADYIADARRVPRYPVCVPIEFIPYDKNGRRIGEAFIAVSKDVSASGLAFLHSTTVEAEFVVVRFPQSQKCADRRIILRVVRVRQVGPLWEIGGRFLIEL